MSSSPGDIENKSIILANHSAKSGPPSLDLYFPKKTVKWGAYQMFGNYRMRRAYLKDVLYIQKCGAKPFKATFMATILAPFNQFIYKGMWMLPSFPDMRLNKTLRYSTMALNENMSTCHMEATVENLKYLKQAGRVSAASAFFGGLLNIKPILIEDAQGKNVAVEKVKGRNTSFTRLVERTIEQFKDVPYQKVFISHADCLDEALKLKEMLSNALGNNIEIGISYIGPIVGASVGPNTMGVFFYGTEVTLNKEA